LALKFRPILEEISSGQGNSGNGGKEKNWGGPFASQDELSTMKKNLSDEAVSEKTIIGGWIAR